MRSESLIGIEIATQKFRRSFFTVIASCVAAPFMAIHAAPAQTWAGNGSNRFWDIASNWSPAAVPGAGANVTNTTAFTIEYRQGTDSINRFGASHDGAFLMSGGTLNVATSFTTNGSFSMTGGNLNVASFTSTNANELTLSGGTLDVSGTLTTNATLLMDSGTLQNATVASPSSLSFTDSYNVLDNVTLGGSSGLTVGGVVGIDDGFSFAHGAAFSVGTGASAGYLLFDSTSGTPSPTFDNATVTLGNSSGGVSGNLGFGQGYASGNTLTLGSGLTVQGTGGIGAVYTSPEGANLVNNGTISSNVASGSLTLNGASDGNVTNGTDALMQADANGSYLYINTSGNGNFTNSGKVLATAGGSVTVSGLELTNTGILEADAGSSIALDSNSSIQTAGSTIVNGTLAITNSGGNVFKLQGGALYGTGSITGTLNNTGAKVGAGIQGASPSAGTLALTGNYVQSAGGTFSAGIGGAGKGTGYDFFTVTGTASLGGSLDIDLFNGFEPTTGETFKIIQDAGTSGTFSNAVGGKVLNDTDTYLFSIVYGSNGVTLTGLGSVPEPPTGVLLLGVILPSAIGIGRRRKK